LAEIEIQFQPRTTWKWIKEFNFQVEKSIWIFFILEIKENTKKLKSFINHISIQYLHRIRHEVRILTRGVEPAKVNFLICGTQKGGTTSLDAYLRQHPEICMAKHKEVHYFDSEMPFLYSRPDYRLYHEFFEPQPGQRIWGETTPIYMYWYSAPRRIWEYNPEMKLILLLRNPIERAYSHWNMQRERGNEPLSFSDAIAEEEKRRRSSLPYQNRRFSYLDRGYYNEQINRLRAYFPANQILLLKSDNLKEDPHSVLDQISNFLAIPRIKNLTTLDLHTRNYETPIDQNTHEFLISLYEYQIKEIEKLTSWDCSDWLVQES